MFDQICSVVICTLQCNFAQPVQIAAQFININGSQEADIAELHLVKTSLIFSDFFQ